MAEAMIGEAVQWTEKSSGGHKRSSCRNERRGDLLWLSKRALERTERGIH